MGSSVLYVSNLSVSFAVNQVQLGMTKTSFCIRTHVQVYMQGFLTFPHVNMLVLMCAYDVCDFGLPVIGAVHVYFV